MKKPIRRPPHLGPAPVKVRRAPGTPTKSQLRAAAIAESQAVKTLWKAQIGEAGKQWGKLHAQELARVDGNIHVLAGLIQMRYGVSREESDKQVQAFFARVGGAPAAAAAKPAVVHTIPA